MPKKNRHNLSGSIAGGSRHGGTGYVEDGLLRTLVAYEKLYATLQDLIPA
ncbi:hypothetical protein SAMN06265379_102252 [Saccharicrinis carchari]|uniref:Uncharacterized protein n=1 Tax=Saccharicrinis carchari TaxID=1168039 RepID=A0A521BZ56_SACCC|nr:hypothetical protein SAMN06265379_102252 [Saccharicrinis carchari]